MKKLIPFTVLAALLLSTGVAAADRRGRGRDHDRGVRDRRPHATIVVRDHRHGGGDRTVRVRPRIERRAVFVRDGAFSFGGGIVKRWRAPVIRHRYYDVHVQPAPVVEYYDQTAGYVWVAGQWQWSGYEWQWSAGHYEVAPDYQDSYDDGYQGGYDGYQGGYDGYQGGYDGAAYPAYPTPPARY